MACKREWLKTALAIGVGALLVLAIQGLGARWNRPAEAATIDQLARQVMVNLVQSIPHPGSERIRGVSGLGDGRTFIVYTDSNIYFYQFGMAIPPN